MAQLQGEVRAAEGRAKSAARAFAAAPDSDALPDVLVEEEGRLKALRKQFADKHSEEKKLRRTPVRWRRSRRAFRDIELCRTRPAAVQAALKASLAPIVCRVIEDQGKTVYQADLALNTTRPAGEGGPVVDETGCGGLQRVWESPAPGPIWFFMPRVR